MGLLDALKGGKAKAPDLDLKEVYDTSIKDVLETRVPGFDKLLNKAIKDYTDRENVRKGEIFQFEEAKRREPDFYLPYYWIATYHMEHKNFQPAIVALHEGIAKALTKSVLCRRLGECYLWVGDLEKAIYWLCTGIMAGDQTDYHAYLYLGYIFDVYDMKNASQWALRRARGISYQMTYIVIEYRKENMERIKEMAGQYKTERAGQMLEAFYRYAKKALGHL